jgi:predicted RNA-binding protein with PUA-like domain
MRYWLMKSEPTTFSLDDLAGKPEQTYHWEGVRNYQARNMLRDEMKVGDLAFFYHSNCKEPGIVGIMEIVKAGYPDFYAFDPDSPYFDPKSDAQNPRWFMVDVKFVQKLPVPISLKTLKQQPELLELALVRRGNRLSLMSVSARQWQCILALQ